MADGRRPAAEGTPGGRPEPGAQRARVLALLEPELAADGFDLLDVRIFQGGGRFQVRIYVDLIAEEPAAADDAADADAPLTGISLDEVARASRTAGMLLEEADLFADRYVIEVSSPGIRRPLRTADHFRRAVGQRVDLKLRGRIRLRGVLQGVGADALDLTVPGGGGGAAPTAASSETPTGSPTGTPTGTPTTTRVAFGQILEANLDPDFDVQAIINADRRERKETKRQERAAKKTGRKKSRPRDKRKTDAGPAEG